MKKIRLAAFLLLSCFTAIAQVDVSVNKTLLSFPPFLYGDQILFQIEVRNNGTVPVYNVTIRDVIPCGLEYFNGWSGWMVSGSDRIGILPGPINPGQSVNVTIDFVLRACVQPNAWLNKAELLSFTDSGGNNIFNQDINVSNNQDTELVPVADLALRKRLVTPSPHKYGDTINFEITVYNQGNFPVQNVSVNDYISVVSGYGFDPTLNPGWTGAMPTFNKVIPGIVMPNDSIKSNIKLILNRTSGGERRWINYAEIEGGQDLNGIPLFDADSTPGSNTLSENNVLPGSPDDDNILGGGPLAGEDEDDHDPAGITVFDLALTKIQASALSSFSYIQTVDYIMTIYNQGNIPATGIIITDYFGDAIQYLNNPKNIGRGWVYNPVTNTASTIYSKTLLPGQSDTIMLDVSPLQFYTKHDSAWINWAEITQARNALTNAVMPDIDSTPDNINGNDAGGRPNSPSDNALNGDGSGQPGDAVASTDEDDHDPHKIQIFDLALRKRKVTPGTHFNAGEDVVFEITIFNQGNVPAKDIVVSDYVRSGYIFIPGGANAGWAGSAPLVKMTIPQILYPGKDTTIFITLRVQESIVPGAYFNYAEISAARDTFNNNRNDDADSIADDNPDNDNQVMPGTPDDDNVFGNSFIGQDEDDHDVAGIELLCQRPTLTVGIPECDANNSTYSVTFYSNVANITASAGTVSGSRVTGIPLGTSVTITANNGTNCAQSLTVSPPANCPGSGGCTYPRLTVGQPVCSGSTWSVSYTTDIGIISVNAGTVSGNTVLNIPVGTNLTVTATNALCVSSVNVASPVNCNVPCANSPISISGPVCETNGAGTYRIHYIVNPGTVVTASAGTLTATSVTGIPSGTNLILTITTPGCSTRVVTVPAASCEVCQRPTLTVGIPECDANNSTYSVTFYSNVANITASAGTVSGSRVTGIPLGTSVTITANNGANCAQSLTVSPPANCPGSGGCTYPRLTVGQPVCSGSTWSVSFTTDIGIISVNAGTVSGNTVLNIPVGTNLTVTATNALCVSSVNVASPVNCNVPCANSPISISGPLCETNGAGTYRIHYIVNPGTVVTASAGTLTATSVTGIPSGTNLILTITTPGCSTRVVTVPAASCEVCQRPTLTVGIPECDANNSTYSVTFYSNVANITASAGTVSGSRVTGIPLGTSVTITANNGANCAQSLTVSPPANCPGSGGCTYPRLTVGQPVCSGSTWSVSFTTDIGIISVNAGTVSGNTVLNIPVGTNLTVTATNALCVSSVNVASPVNCNVPCANSPISISGPVCETNGAGTYRIHYIVNPGTVVTASAGTLTATSVTGIPSGTNLILTITTPGCSTRVVTVPAASCEVCQRPTLTVGIPECDANNSTYSVTFYSNVANITASAGTVSGSRVTGIPLGTSVTITANNGANCAQSLTVSPPANCPGSGGCTYPRLTVGQPVCSGSTWSVSFTTDIGIISVNAGTVSGNTVLNIPVGTNLTVTATNALCVSSVNVASPVNCNVPCANSPISISGPVCETNGAGTYRIHYIVNPGTVVTASAGTLTATSVTGIPSGTDLILTITTPGCSTRVVTVPAATCQLGNATIGNFVWHDQNGDGQQGSSEPGIGGVTVMLLDPLGNMIAQTTTASNGAYTISGIPPGTYYLKFSIPSGFQPTFALIGNPASDSDLTGTFGAGTTNLFTLAPGQVNNSLDAGFFRCALIGERVWYDTNRNDIQDNPENGINGLRVNLWRNHFGVWTIWDFTFTGHKPNTPSEDGWWQFCAPPGQYYVQIIIPPLGLVQVQPNRGNNPNRDSDLTNAFGQGTTNSFTVSSGGSKLDLAGGYYPMAIAGNLVWNDLNMNGIQDLNEPKVSGVKVEAFDAENHQKLGESVTDQTGTYEIDYLPQKNVYFKFSVPVGQYPTLPNLGSDDENSDVDHSNGLNTTRTVKMKSGEFNQNIDLGLAYGALPVNWLKVDVKRQNNSNVISWLVDNEINVRYYEIERRAPSDEKWESLHIINSVQTIGLNKSDYICEDNNAKDFGIYYYRVKQVDFDGRFNYSRIVSIEVSESVRVLLYPVPASEFLHVEFNDLFLSLHSVDLLDLNGNFVKRLFFDQDQSSGNLYKIDINDIPGGKYVLKLKINEEVELLKHIVIIK